jgi:ligand-binding sensor domain-containing protein/signal transduction histidine kinase
LHRFIFLLAIICTGSYAQAQPPAIFFDHLGTRDGLPNNSVQALVKDAQGFLWIGTADGLSRYDGRNFRTFHHSIYDSNSIPHNDVYSLSIDNLGYVWAGTFNGLCAINPATFSISRMRLPVAAGQTSFLVVGDVKQNPQDGIIWAATSKGLFKINRKKDILMPALDNGHEQVLSNAIITKILFDDEHLWLATYDGILKYHPDSGTYKRYTVPAKQGITHTLVKSMYMDRHKRIWLATWGRGLQCFDPRTESFRRFLPNEKLGERPDANILLNISQTGYPGQDSILWIAADALGLLAFDMGTGRFTRYTAGNEHDMHGIYGHGLTFFAGREEGMWIGTTHGLYRYDPQHQLFRHASLEFVNVKHCLREVLAAAADPADPSGKTLFVSTWSCGSFRFNTASGKTLPLPAWITEKVNTSGHITAFHTDSSGILWIGTSANGLHRVDQNKKEVRSFYPPTPTKSVTHITDDGNGNLWTGSRNGLFVFNKTQGHFMPVFRSGLNAPASVSEEVMGLTKDKDNNLWFCTNLYKDKQPVAGKIPAGSRLPMLYYHIPGKAGSFPENSPLQGITSDRNNNIWCASWNGLVYWNASDEQPVFRRLARKDGLCNDKVFKVQADRTGAIWIATLRGLSCYDPQAGSFRNFHTSEGLHKDEVSNFFMNEMTGEMIAGFDGGMDIFDPALARRKKDAPGIIITGLKVFNEPYAQDKKYQIDKGLAVLRPGQNMLTISFSALSFTNPQELVYAYRMQGVDKDWTVTSNDFVTYHNLPPGSMRFEVRSRNADGSWSKAATWVDIDIAPPFYLRWWFLLMVFAAIAALAYLLYRGRIRRLEEKFRMRSTIARDLHDDIGSTLTSINILSRVSRSNLEKDHTKAAGLLQKITEQSEDMQQSMSDIIWAIRPDNDKLENMAARMREYMSHTLEAKNISIHFEADEQVLKESLTMEARRDFFLIFKEAVNNAAKYAGSSIVSVTLCKERNNIVLRISDEGAGFDVTRKRTSNGLRNMQARAHSLKAALVITSAPGKGTTVALTVPTT